MEAPMSADYTLLLCAVLCAALVGITVMVYDRIVRGLRLRLEALEVHVLLKLAEIAERLTKLTRLTKGR